MAKAKKKSKTKTKKVAKKATKSVVKKKTIVAKKTTTKKTAKKVAKSAAAKKVVAKKSTAKATVAKKAAAKKSTVKKKVAKKAVPPKVAKKSAKKGAVKTAAGKSDKVVAPKISTKTETLSEESTIKKSTKPAKAKSEKPKIEEEVLPKKLKNESKAPVVVEENVAVEEFEEVEGIQEYADAEVILTDAEGRRYCRVPDCDQIALVDGYCRYHYLLFWKKIQIRKKILQEGKLEEYIVELTSRYPDKYLEVLRKDLSTEREFINTIRELELDDEVAADSEGFDEEAERYNEEVRGIGMYSDSDREDDY